MKKFVALAGLLICVLGLSQGVSYAVSADVISHGDHDHVGFGDTITINEGDSASDIVCAFCTVRAHGDITGDVVTFFGDVTVDGGKSISGDVVTFGGKLGLGSESRINGDLVLFGGRFEEASSAVIRGDRVVLDGGGWLLVAFLPLLLPIGVIWLIVYLVRRNRYQFPAYPGGRRY